jgi:hypothetical protein
VDATVAWSLLDQYEPEIVILVAGANPVMRPLQQQTWETLLRQLAYRRQDRVHMAA